MEAGYWILLGLVLFFAGGLLWRYLRLLRALRTYAGAVEISPADAVVTDRALAALSHVIRLVIAEHARQNASLEADRARLAAVLDQMADAVLIADADGIVQYCNPAVLSIFHLPRAVGRSVPEVLRDHRLVETWRRSRASAGSQSDSVEIPTAHQFLQIIAVPDSHAGGSLLLIQDLTRVRRLETVRQDFVSNVSHELRTPLASLKALAETLLDGALQDPQAASRFLRRMVTEVDALTQMSEELLALSAIESGKAELLLAPVSPRDLLDAAVERLKAQADRAGLALHVECADTLPQVRGDLERLEQVLVNLIHNAIKFTPAGGEVVVSAGGLGFSAPTASAAPHVEFSVRDTGPGISGDDLPRIFERFYRADRSRSSGGTGLGLSIARHIVEAHGGRIWAESVEGVGSTFRFTVPALSSKPLSVDLG